MRNSEHPARMAAMNLIRTRVARGRKQAHTGITLLPQFSRDASAILAIIEIYDANAVLELVQ